MKITIMPLLESFPLQCPAGWIVFNAPRPLFGTECWQGQFRHGVFYAAINPSDPYAQQWIRENAYLDGWVCEYWGMTDNRLLIWAKDYCVKNGISWHEMKSCYDIRIIKDSWLYNNDRREETLLEGREVVDLLKYAR